MDHGTIPPEAAAVICVAMAFPAPLLAAGGGQAVPDPVSGWLADGDATDAFGAADGVLAGTTGFAAGRSGQAFSFDGAGQVLLPDDTFDGLEGGAVTIVAWLSTSQSGDPPRYSRTTGLRILDGVPPRMVLLLLPFGIWPPVLRAQLARSAISRAVHQHQSERRSDVHPPYQARYCHHVALCLRARFTGDLRG